MLPDEIIMAYLEPWLALSDFLDLKKDKEDMFPQSQVRPESLLESLDSAGVDKAIILPLDFGVVAKPKQDVEEYNDWVFESCARYPDRLIGLMGIDPSRGEQAISLMRKYHSKFEPKGIKIYPPTGWYPSEERIAAFWKEANDMDLTVVTHAGASWGPLQEERSRPLHMRPILERYPDLRVVIAHLGGKYRNDTYEMAPEFPNMYTDCSALQGWLPSEPSVVIDRLKEAVTKVGPDRVMFGSDWPLFDLNYPYQRWCMFMREEMYCDEGTREKILGLNARRIFRL